jgi:hypothetical protein
VLDFLVQLRFAMCGEYAPRGIATLGASIDRTIASNVGSFLGVMVGSGVWRRGRSAAGSDRRLGIRRRAGAWHRRVGGLGELYAEAIEAINPRPVEAIRARGSGSLAVFSVGVLPQAMPLLISYTLLDFEANISSATILGIGGAGGIGFEVQTAFSQFLFHRVLTIMIEIMVMVTIVDRHSALIRARLI